MNNKNYNAKDLNIPISDGTDFSQWHIQMKIHLQSRDLLNVCEKSIPYDTNITATNKCTKENYKSINTITNCINKHVFVQVINSETTNNSNLLWTKIKDQYASVRVLNQGCVWMDLQRCFYKGNLQFYIDTCRKLLLELESVSIKISNELLSYSLLGKLEGDTKLHQLIEALTSNKELIKNPGLVPTRLQDYVHMSNSKHAQPTTTNPSALISTTNKHYKVIY
ncbi:hypothetical protein O181_058022 [Austropuccinia psidii MF-1]|uniref:DUF4219 domain-containing protein n=1 Tax=Austropuccinia psidii MF-1 TaxID=1389203 RepID=A0A9Q3HW10_9BASI|nr:hypothetical protein [Austropuccinia psidii MF-1]